MIDVEEYALRAFEEDPAAPASGLVQVAPDRPRELEDEIGDFGEVVAEPLAVYRRLSEARAKRIVMGAEAIEQGLQLAEMGEVADPDRAAPAAGPICRLRRSNMSAGSKS